MQTLKKRDHVHDEQQEPDEEQRGDDNQDEAPVNVVDIQISEEIVRLSPVGFPDDILYGALEAADRSRGRYEESEQPHNTTIPNST